jgi:hypothetical protein
MNLNSTTGSRLVLGTDFSHEEEKESAQENARTGKQDAGLRERKEQG